MCGIKEPARTMENPPAASVCPACHATQARPHCGAYNLRCVACCARLVVSARPLRHAQEGLLACITRHPENPSKADVLNAIKHHANQG